MPQDDTDLQAILDNQAGREQGRSVSSQITIEMKQSLMFHTSWEQLLQTTPTAITSIGACFVASSSPTARERLRHPKDSLKYNSIQADLVECGNMGRLAFTEADRQMGAINMTSAMIDSKIKDVMSVLEDPESAARILRPQFQAISRGAETCLDVAIAMDKRFVDWLTYACELYTACVQQESTAREEPLSKEICLAAENTYLNYEKSTEDETRKTQELLGKQIATTSDVFRKFSDEFPTGWDIMGQQVVGDLASAVTGAINAAIPTLMRTIIPTVKPKGEAIASPIPNNATDPGYTEIQKISAFLAILQVIVAGQKDGGINWEMAKSDISSKGGPSSVIKFVGTILADAKRRFTSLTTSGEPSQILTQILNVASQVAKDLQDVISKPGSDYPAKDSAEVKKWQGDFAEVYARANTLLATAVTIPGTAASGVPLISRSRQRGDQITATSAQGQAVLEASKIRLATTTQMLTTTRDNYAKSVDMLSQQQNKVADIQKTLMKVTTSTISLAEIKRILFETIKVIMEIKAQITSLVRFYKAIGPILDSCVKYQVEPFINTIKAMEYGDQDPNGPCSVGTYMLLESQSFQIYSSSLTLRSYFSLFGDIAKFWMELSQQSVFLGLMMCEELSYAAQEGDPDAMASRLRKLSQWSENAANNVKRLAGDKQRQTMDGMESHIGDFTKRIRDISAPSTSTAKAIEAGTQVTQAAAQDSIEQRAKTSVLSRFAVVD